MSPKPSVAGFVGCDGDGRHSVMCSRSGFCKTVSMLGARERIVTAWDVTDVVMSGVVEEEIEMAGLVMWREIS